MVLLLFLVAVISAFIALTPFVLLSGVGVF